jgi:Transglycosylase SLT domain
MDYNALSDDEIRAIMGAASPKGKASIDSALAAEGVTGQKANFIKSIYQQESSSGANPTTSNRGATGGMQIIPATFNSVADKGWSINNPEHNLRAGIRYASQGYDASGGDPALAGAYYYGGPGGMRKAAQGIAVSDPKNPTAPNTLQYGQQVAARMPAMPDDSSAPAMPQALQAAQSAPPAKVDYASMSDDQLRAIMGKPVAKQTQSTSSLAGQIPGANFNNSVPAPNYAPAPNVSKDSLLQKIGGVLETPLALGSSMVGGVVGPIAGLYKGLTSGKYGTQEGVNEASKYAGDVANSMTYQPRTQTGQEITGTIGKTLNDSGVIGVAPMMGELGAVGKAATPINNSISDLLRSTSEESANGASKLINSVKPTINPRISELADKAQEFGIPLRPDMLTNNKFAKILGNTLEQVPLSGSKAVDRQGAYTSALIKLLGGDESTAKLTPDVFSSAMQKSGGTIGDISARTPIKVTGDFTQGIKAELENANKFETSDVAKVVNNYADELTSKGQDGIIDGEAFRKINSKIGKQIASTSNGDLKNALGSLQDVMHDALQKSVSAEDAPLLQQARQQYAIGKTLEPLVAKSPNGDISPSALMGRVTSNNAGKSRMANDRGGQLGDLARIGQQFLKEPATSNTAERSLTNNLLTGGAGALAALNPMVAAGLASTYGVANLYNRYGSKLADMLRQSK